MAAPRKLASVALAAEDEAPTGDTDTPFVACTNCGDQASFTLGDVVNVVNYCGTCLPRHFVADASKGHYPLVVP